MNQIDSAMKVNNFEYTSPQIGNIQNTLLGSNPIDIISRSTGLFWR